MKRKFIHPRMDIFCIRAEKGFAGSDPAGDPWDDWGSGSGDIEIGAGGRDDEFA